MSESNTLFVARNEYKYFMSRDQALTLQKELELVLERDEFSKNGSYRVKSLYFDSVFEQDYLQKLAGVEKRKKIRLRIYDEEAENAKLEMKEKNGIFQHKYSVKLKRADAKQISIGNYESLLYANDRVAQDIYVKMAMNAYRPKVIIEYNRLAFSYPEFSTRITFDSEIKSSELNLELYERSLEYQNITDEFVILEIKFNGTLINFVSKILEKYELQNVAVSKYCGGRTVFGKYL